MFMVGCKRGKEDDIVMSVLNKTAFYHENQLKEYQVKLSTAFHLKKKYPGFVFVECPSKREIAVSFKGIPNVYYSKVKQVGS